MAKKHFLLVDGNSIAHANHNGTVLSVGGFQTQALFGMLKSLRVLLRDTPGEKELVVIWDGKAQFRFDIFPEYKGNRAPVDAEGAAKRAAFDKQTPFIEKALELLGVKQLRSPLLEADDLGYHLSRTLSAQGHQVTLVSGDKDWLQNIDENVSWFDPIVDRRVDAGNFFEFTGYMTTAAFAQGKALQGDISDNCDGIFQLGEVTAQKLLARWKDMELFFEAVDNGSYVPAARKPRSPAAELKAKSPQSPHPETALASPEGRVIFRRNVALMDLSRARRPEKGEVIQKLGAPNPDLFLRLCERLAFRSILAERAMFLKTFNLFITPT